MCWQIWTSVWVHSSLGSSVFCPLWKRTKKDFWLWTGNPKKNTSIVAKQEFFQARKHGCWNAKKCDRRFREFSLSPGDTGSYHRRHDVKMKSMTVDTGWKWCDWPICRYPHDQFFKFCAADILRMRRKSIFHLRGDGTGGSNINIPMNKFWEKHTFKGIKLLRTIFAHFVKLDSYIKFLCHSDAVR